MTLKRMMKGFTLIEVLLVLVIISIMIYAAIGYVQQRALQMRMDRASLQTQQILNAGMAYYVQKGSWPTNLAALQSNGNLPNITIVNPWAQSYQTATSNGLFYVYSSVMTAGRTRGAAMSIANSIAGTLPLAYTSTDASGAPPSASQLCGVASTTCYVVAAVNIPGQDLNNVGAVNFAGMYKPGFCVPVPVCPTYGNTSTTPQVFVSVVKISGTMDKTGSNFNIYPIESFTAYTTAASASPPNCTGAGPVIACANGTPSGNFWRVCLQIVTEKGTIDAASSPGWGDQQILLAFTRCALPTESTTSGTGPFTTIVGSDY